ncbi:MAG: hypothetical protein ACXWID_03480 [Pyrinomonadaceae bacterium]
MIRKFYVLFLALTLVMASTAWNAGVTGKDREIHAGVLLGPCGSSAAAGPTGINDDFTNLSIGADIVTGPNTVTANSASVVFRNTLQNTGTADDAFIIAAPSLPPGFRAEVSTDNGDTYAVIDQWSNSITVAVGYRAVVILFVRITAPGGLPVLQAFETVIRATSTVSPVVTNETINRIYTGFIRLENAQAIENQTGVGGPADAVPGAQVEFIITYSNISSMNGVDCALLIAYNLVISADGRKPPNNWGVTTDHIVGASDDRGGLIVGDRPNSQSLANVVMRLEAGESGVFRFRRMIR